jgi:hypothetical protein
MREFGLILLAALGSSILGAGFGWLIGALAPEFLTTLFPMQPLESPERVAAALGAIAGLFLGAGAMAVGLLIAAVRGRAGKDSARES